MSIKNPYVVQKSGTPSDKVASPSEPKISQKARMTRAIETLSEEPPQQVQWSLNAAQRYRTDASRYSHRERAAAQHAMDFNGMSMNALTFVENTSFPGFPILAQLSQLPEYRSMHERFADECIRCWGKAVSAGDTDATKLQAIEAELERIDLRGVIRQAVIHDQAFGGAHVFFKFKDDKDVRFLPLSLAKYGVPIGSFEGLRVIEPYWVTPNNYNSIDPTAADFYKPSSWWMLSVEVHASRLQTIVSRPVPDMLKPTYSFRGVSMSQLAIPYIDNWLRTRQSVSDTVKQFSVSGVKTDLAQALNPGGGVDLAQRAALINAYRDNRNLLMLDMATEDFFQVNTPLSGLDALQAQAQEQMSAVCHLPLVILLGVTPTGLNASSEGEIRVFYDYVSGFQENVLQAFMLNVLRVVQLSLYGEVDPHVIWEWAPLMELTRLEEADVRAKDAETDAKYIEQGVITPDKVAEVLHNDAHSRYSGLLDPLSMEELPDDDIAGITAKILEINPAAIAGEQLEQAGVLGMTQNTLIPMLSSLPDPTITDPSAQEDPGAVEAHPDDMQTAQ